ncbi:MAG: glycosyltransferase family 2 protein [Chloroflexi bacterium]|nr:glycosyltransferase family 2 protein [Chloroflexota bacterium]
MDMKISVIIPVWNGAAVLPGCLEALAAHADDSLQEIICVNNASTDDSANIVAQFALVHLLDQPVNLGFAGGVNVGLAAAQGDVLVLLNQDCLVHAGWLTAVTTTFTQYKTCGVVGGIIYNEDGAIDHTGAHISQPEGYGVHETAVRSTDTPYPVEYVTGALFAIRRQAWQDIGPLDDAFYPGYFEESDYCYRARRLGYQSLCAPGVQATHLRSSRAWQQDPIRHNANQHRSRYRFIAKHFSATEVAAFAAAEERALGQPDVHPHQTMGRLLALRDTLRDLPAITARRQQDLEQPPTPEHERLLSVSFTHLLHRVWARAHETDTAVAHHRAALQQTKTQLDQLQQQQYDLLRAIYFKHPQDTQPESTARRLWRRLVLRPLSVITLRDYFLHAKLGYLHAAYLDQLTHQLALTQRLLETQTNQRLELLETVADYEYR